MFSVSRCCVSRCGVSHECLCMLPTALHLNPATLRDVNPHPTIHASPQSAIQIHPPSRPRCQRSLPMPITPHPTPEERPIIPQPKLRPIIRQLVIAPEPPPRQLITPRPTRSARALQRQRQHIRVLLRVNAQRLDRQTAFRFLAINRCRWVRRRG